SPASQVLPKLDPMKTRLDTRTVPRLALAKGRDEEICWDAELEGFGLRLRRGVGDVRRTYVAQYRTNGHTRRVTLGTAEGLTPTQAREGARKVLARVSLGEDPQADKAAKRVQAAKTFRAVVAAYLAAKQSELRPISYKIAKLYLTGPYFRPLHTMGLAEIS